jgi:predicted GNAT superfamily acetyltransferase
MYDELEMMSGEQTEVKVRECRTIAEFDACISLQREAFGLPDLEISPRRHLIVSRVAGGWTLGAFISGEMVGFVHHLVAARVVVGRADEITGYSHMMAVARAYQNRGIGARLKWAQRERAVHEGRRLINWTWDPMQARNAHFNLNRLGVIVRSYAANFYGTDYNTLPQDQQTTAEAPRIDSDRLFAEWHLDSARVRELAAGKEPALRGSPAATIEIPTDWATLMKEETSAARREQSRVRSEFEQAFAAGLVCAAFARDSEHPRYLLYDGDGG